MNEREAWAVLEIAETKDPLEIRRAYTRRLKAIDPESDPQAFIELREARDLLTWLVQQPDQDGADRTDPLPDLPADAPSALQEPLPATAAVPPAAPAPALAQTPTRLDDVIEPALFDTIERILFQDQGPPDEAALEAATAELLAHPAMERIDIAAGVESWLARVIAGGRPRSDVMIEPVIARFGWEELGDDWRRSEALDIILQRRADRGFETALLRDHPRYRPIFALLRRPDPAGLFTRWWRSGDMRAFLVYAGPRHPTTMETFDREALAFWDKYVFEPPKLRARFENWRQSWRGDNDGQRLLANRKSMIGAIVVGLVVLSIFFKIFTGGTPPGRLEPNYRTVEQDLTQPLEAAFGRDMPPDLLAAANPVLYGQLSARWREASRRRDPILVFERDVERIIDGAYRNGLRGGTYALLAEYWHLQLGRLIALREGPGGAGACVAHLTGAPGQGLAPMDHVVAERELRARAVRVTAQALTGGSAELMPLAVAQQASRETGLDNDTLRNALGGRSTPANRCNAAIAVLRSALELPQVEGADFLRRMLN